MSTTGAILVQDAMYEAQILGQDQTATSGDSQLVLRYLNRMLDIWRNEDLLIPGGVSQDSFTMTAGTASYASTLLTTMGRPTSIDSIYVRLSNLDYEVDLIDNQQYQSITYKPTTGIPNVCFYDGAYPTANFNFYPTPYAAFTCFVVGLTYITQALTLGTTVNLPPGYEQAIIDNLAVKIWRPFKGSTMPIPPDLMKQAADSKAWLKRTNFAPLEMDLGLQQDQPSPDAFIYRGF